ncbi:glycine-rich domain-containing protein [Algoriphagus sp.]|uniref:beta strand repeat-containing protein n=1 Tax=Algoriphagus sp. TaxID=1872435 RepID=UPI00261810E6|nr:T9SS type A sorting domain-containing protein [Algoriphagus sp.]
MKKHLPVLLLFFFLILISWKAFAQTQTITSPGSGTFTVPSEVTSITVEVWGGGGKGGARSGSNGAAAGGGGGAYSRSVLPVSPGQVINYRIGFGATGFQPGQDTWFFNNSTLMAKGGNSVSDNSTTGVAGGDESAGFGDFRFSGGNGADVVSGDGGGGGSSAGINANGNNATNRNGALAPLGGGEGGDGKEDGNGANGQGPGSMGSFPGGGGGGGVRSSSSGTDISGGNGGNGQIRISYITLSSSTGTDNQSVCEDESILTTTYTIPPGSFVSVLDLPPGLTSNFNSSTNTITISGTPETSGTYTLNVTPGFLSIFTSAPFILSRTGSVTVIPTNTVSSSNPDQSICINTQLSNITHITTGATGIANDGISGANGLPPGISASWNSGVITISGSPTATNASPYNYSIPLTGGCGEIYATGTINVTPDNTITLVGSSDQTQCINEALTEITFNTTGATGIQNNGVLGANGLPPGVSASWNSGVITISGVPISSGSFTYSIPLAGGCGSASAIGTITVTPNNTAIPIGSEDQSQCINEPLVDIIFNTTGATGILNDGVDGANGLPPGVSASWNAGVITISGTPTSTAGSPYNYSIPLTGGCGNIVASGIITVSPDNTVLATTAVDQTLCIDTPLNEITFNTSGATGIENDGVSGANGLPPGVSATWNGNVISISGSPTEHSNSPYSYSIPLLGGCNDLYAEGTITVNPASTITVENMADQRICDGDTFSELSVTATGTGTLSYQWFSNSNPSKTGATPIGSNQPSYSPPADAIGTTYYYVEVTSDCSPIATSRFMQATVEPITVITTELDTSDDVECFGDGFDPLFVGAEGADLTYQWYVNTDQQNTGGTLISGATSNTFTPPSTDIGSILYYYVVVSGYCSSDTSIISGEYRVNPPETVIDDSPDSNNYTVCQGDPFPEQTALASGEGTITYQWYSNDIPQNTGGTLISGATDPTFTPPSDVVGTKYYYATGRSNCGTVPTAVSGAFTVTQPSVITSEDLDAQEICIDSAFEPISIIADGTGAVEYQWYSNTSPVADTLGVEVIELSGEVSNSFIPPTTLGTLYYFVKVSSECGPNVLSNISGAFKVNPLPTPTLSSNVDADPVVCENSSITYTTESGQSNYIWEIPGQVQGTDYTISAGGIGLNNHTVTLTWLTEGLKNVSVYYTDPNGCTASSPAVNSITVDPLPEPTLTSNIDADPVICEGNTVIYTTESGQNNYMWNIDGIENTDYTVSISGASLNQSNRIQVTWLTNGTKNVSVNYINSTTGCTASSPEINTITVDPLPVPTFSVFPGFEVCEQSSVTYTTQSGQLDYVWNLPGSAGTDYTIISGGTSEESITLEWLTLGSKTVSVSYTNSTTGCVANSSASSTTEVVPFATVGPTSVATPSFCITDTSPLSFSQPTTGVTSIGTPSGLPPGITATFNSGTGNIEFSGIPTTPGFYSYSIPLNGNCINGLTATGTIDVTPEYQLTSVSSVSATITGGTASITINGDVSSLPNGEYEVTYILDDGISPPAEYTSAPFNVSNGLGTFATIPLDNLDVEAYELTIQTIRKTTGGCITELDAEDPINTTFFSVCGAAFAADATFFVPAGVFEITIQATGAGTAGQTKTTTISVNPGQAIGIYVGEGDATGTGRDTWVTRDSSLPDPETSSYVYATGNGGPGQDGQVNISYSCPDSNDQDCLEVVDDGAVSGTTIIRFTCDDVWEVPEGLVEFTIHAIGAGGGGGMGQTGGGGGGGGIASTTVYSNAQYGFPAGNSLNITVGKGGDGASTPFDKGDIGDSTSVTGIIPDANGNININLIALGGGGGGSFSNLNGSNGASGGGGAHGDQGNNIPGIGGSGTLGQGNNGGNGGRGNNANHARAGGGGGGAGGIGEDGSGSGVGQSQAGNGGEGAIFEIEGIPYAYGAGGGGIGYNFNSNDNDPGLGGEVNGIRIGGDATNQGKGNPGTAFTGSGGGAGTTGGGQGGSGVVYITYFNFSILPIEYLYFDVEYQEESRTGKLNWATAKEWENAHFEIERSINGVNNWETIAEVPGAGYSEVVTEYEFIDQNLPAAGGIVYYRLKDVNFYQEYSYSNTRSMVVPSLSGNSSWVAYPNPSHRSSEITLDLLNSSAYKDEPITVQISDIRGVSESYTVRSPTEVTEVVNSHLQITDFGIYIIQLSWGNQQQQLKIIRN